MSSWNQRKPEWADSDYSQAGHYMAFVVPLYLAYQTRAFIVYGSHVDIDDVVYVVTYVGTSTCSRRVRSVHMMKRWVE